MKSVVSRRDLLALLGLGAASLAVPTRAFACDGAQLRIGLDVFPQTLNPLAVRDLHGSRVLAAMYEGLTKIDQHGDLHPALAERWTASENGQVWRFHLRRGVRFHTGRTFTAHDVKKTFEALLASPTSSFAVPGLARVQGYPEAKSLGEGLRGVEVVDEHTIDIRFATPCAIFPFFKFLIVDVDFAKSQGEEWFTKVSAGTGPYRFANWTPGSQINLAAHGSWWSGHPAHDNLAFIVTGGREASITAFNSNDVDLVLVDADLVRKTADDIGFQRSLVSMPRMQSRCISLDFERYEPFRDKRVRLALSLMIDRQAVAERFFRGMAAVHNGVVPPSLLSDDSLSALEYNPGAAQALLAAAGYPGGKGMAPFDLATLPEYRQEFAYYASQWSNIGLPVTLNVVPRAEFVEKTKKRAYTSYHLGWTAGYPDPMNFLGELFGSASPFNHSGWSNAEFDALLERANATVDKDDRDALYRAAERLVMNELPVVPIVVPDYVALRCAGIADRNLSSFGGVLIR